MKEKTEIKKVEIKKEKVNFFKKWYIYQKERFPVLVYGIYILSIVLAAFKFGYACQGYKIGDNIQSLATSIYDGDSGLSMKTIQVDHYFYFDYKVLIPMFISMFLLFLMVRIVDEFKDYKEDCKYRPYRPVPRGLVSRWELAIVFVICLIAQIGIFINQYNSFNLNEITLVGGIATAVMFILLGFDFFIGKYLSKHKIISLFFDELLMFTAVIYILSFVPNFYSYSTSWDSMLCMSSPSSFKVYMIFFSIFALLPYIGAWIMEIARKMRCEDCEEKGVKTYTAVFGIPKASIILSIVEIVFMAVSCFEVWLLTKLNNAISLPVIFYLIFIVLGVICLIFNFMFKEIQSHKWSKNVEYMGYSQVILTYIIFFFIFI